MNLKVGHQLAAFAGDCGGQVLFKRMEGLHEYTHIEAGCSEAFVICDGCGGNKDYHPGRKREYYCRSWNPRQTLQAAIPYPIESIQRQHCADDCSRRADIKASAAEDKAERKEHRA